VDGIRGDLEGLPSLLRAQGVRARLDGILAEVDFFIQMTPPPRPVPDVVVVRDARVP
jgi:hypothetical protein